LSVHKREDDQLNQSNKSVIGKEYQTRDRNDRNNIYGNPNTDKEYEEWLEFKKFLSAKKSQLHKPGQTEKTSNINQANSTDASQSDMASQLVDDSLKQVRSETETANNFVNLDNIDR